MEYVMQTMEERRQHEDEMTALFLAGLEGMDRIRLVGTKDLRRRVGVIAIDFLHRDNAEVADDLEQKYGILTRCGLHCAPSAHKTLGTFPQGVVRFSIGYRTTKEDILTALKAIEDLA